MSKKNKITTSDLLDELKKTVDARGEQATATILKNGRAEFSCEKYIQFVILQVCNVLAVPVEVIITGQYEKEDKIKYTKGFIVYYLREKKIEWVDIKQALKHKDQSWLWDLAKLIKQLKQYLPAHQPWITLKEKLDSIIKNYKP